MAVPYIPGAMITATRNRYPLATDQYHNERVDYDAAPESTLPIPGCCWQPKAGTEFVQDTDRLVVRGDLYLPADADLNGLDTVTVPGVGEFHVDGPVVRWPNVGGLGHAQVALVWFKEG